MPNAEYWQANEPSMFSAWRAEEDATTGSRKLLEAMQTQFLSLALKHRGLTIKDAQLFLMNSESPAVGKQIFTSDRQN
jgi:hypothetical protein